MRSSERVGGSRAVPYAPGTGPHGRAANAQPTVQPNPRNERVVAADLDRIFNTALTSHALWGVKVKSLDTGRVLYARNATTLMMPASNMKIVTLAAAAEALGWDYRFKTVLETSGTIEGGVLKGDLIVRGSGDPTINRRDNRATTLFDQWAAALKAAGITSIQGNVVGDARAFDRRLLGQGWSWDYLQAGYAAPVSALEFNENIATVTIRPGAAPGDDAPTELTPGTGLGLVHHVVTGAPGSATSIDIERVPEGGWLDVMGTIAADARPATRDVAVANPALFFAHSLLRGLTERGIGVRGLPQELRETKNTLAPLPRQVIVESESPPLRDIAVTMMKVSQNLAEEPLAGGDEALDRLWRCEHSPADSHDGAGEQLLDGDRALEPAVVGRVGDAEPTAADRAPDDETPGLQR